MKNTYGAFNITKLNNTNLSVMNENQPKYFSNKLS